MPNPTTSPGTPASPGRDRLIGTAAILTSALLFAVNGIMVKSVLTSRQVDATRLVSLRTLVSALLLTGLLALTRPAELRPGKKVLGRLAVLGILGIAMLHWTYFNHLQRLPVAVGMIIQYTAPILVAVLARFVFHEAVRRQVWLALGLALVGLALVVGIADSDVTVGLDPVGLGFALAAMFALTTYYLMGERSVALISPLGTQTWMLIFAALFWQVLRPAWTFDWTRLASPVPVPGTTTGATRPLWAPVAYLVVGGTMVAYLLVMFGIRRIGATMTSLLGMTEPVIITALGWLVLNETLTGWQVLGGTLAVGGMMLAATSRRRGLPARSRSANPPTESGQAHDHDNGTLGP